MNYSLKDNGLLDGLSRDKAAELVPMSLYVFVLMITGLVGNILVCVFYGKRDQVTPTTRLIVAVALIDTITCVLMPTGVVDLCLSYKFTSSPLCKLTALVNHITTIASIMTLIAIAAFRFRAVCKPLSSQFSLQHANTSVMIGFGFAVLVSMPILVTHESVDINIRVNSTLTIVGYDCNTSKEPSLKPLNLAVNVLHFFGFLAASLTLFVLYGKMGVHIRRYYKRKKLIFEGVVSLNDALNNTSEIIAESSTDNHTCDQGTTDTDAGQTFDIVDEDKESMHMNECNKEESDLCEIGNNQIEHGKDILQVNVHFNKGDTETNDQLQLKKAKIYKTVTNITSEVATKQVLMFFIITLIFVVSFLPYLVMNISRTLSKNKDGNDNFTNWIQFYSRSYLINSAVNPFVYGLFNTEFRNFVKRLFCRCCNK